MNSTSSSSLSLNLPHDDLLRLGIVTISVGGYPDLSMIEAVKRLISSPSKNLTSLLGPVFGRAGLAGTDPRTVLLTLDAYLDVLPRDVSLGSHSSFYTIPIAVTTVSLILRLVGRKWVTGRIRIDDWMMFVAWAFAVALCANKFFNAEQAYAGRHVYDLPYRYWKKSFMVTYVFQILWCPGSLAVKLSWLLFYWHLAPPSFLWFRKLVVAVGIFSIMVMVCAFTLVVFQCRPINYWNNPLRAKCIDMRPIILWLWTPWVLGHFLTMLLPIPVVLTLKLTKKEKLGVVAMFALGTLACYAGIVRVLYSLKYLTDPDRPFKVPFAGFWSLMELEIAICASCIPAVRSILRQCFPQWFSSTSTSRLAAKSEPKPTTITDRDVEIVIPTPAVCPMPAV